MAKAVASLAAFLMLFAPLSAQTGVRIRGQVVPIPQGTPDGLLRVTLGGPTLSLNAPVGKDGSFEFANVPPGQVFIGEPVSRSGQRLLVKDEDVNGIVLTPPVRLLGQIVAEDGGWLPSRRDPIDPVLRLEVRGEKSGKKRPQFVRSDGLFAFAPLPPDDYEVNVLLLPEGYSIRSMSYGGSPISQGRFKVTGPEQAFLRITVAAQARDANDATLVLTQNGRGPGYIEGALTFFELRSEDSKGLQQKRRLGGEFCAIMVNGCQPSGAPPFDSLSLAIPAGTYQVTVYDRGCDGNCGRLGPRAQQCSATFTIAPGQTLHANRAMSLSTCEFEFSPTVKK